VTLDDLPGNAATVADRNAPGNGEQRLIMFAAERHVDRKIPGSSVPYVVHLSNVRFYFPASSCFAADAGEVRPLTFSGLIFYPITMAQFYFLHL
jgi:hypothetical protein